ncbi:hypothetical protein acdb102_06660 [Acidothermaceae bacterium B102]|nr:hypothetical protein acdb102_06660 [Acidothermaceae bacterium B102]
MLGTGVLGFILSLFHVFVVSVSGPGSALIGSLGSRGAATAWHNWGVIGMLFVLAATAVVAVRLFAPASMPKLPVGVNLLALALSGLGFLCIVIAWFHNSSSASFSGVKISVHLGIFGYLLVLDVLAQAVASFLLFKSSGEVMPDFKAMQAAKTPGAVPPPPGYGTPPPAATYPPATPSGDFTLDDTQPPTASH